VRSDIPPLRVKKVFIENIGKWLAH